MADLIPVCLWVWRWTLILVRLAVCLSVILSLCDISPSQSICVWVPLLFIFSCLFVFFLEFELPVIYHCSSLHVWLTFPVFLSFCFIPLTAFLLLEYIFLYVLKLLCMSTSVCLSSFASEPYNLSVSVSASFSKLMSWYLVVCIRLSFHCLASPQYSLGQVLDVSLPASWVLQVTGKWREGKVEEGLGRHLYSSSLFVCQSFCVWSRCGFPFSDFWVCVYLSLD